MSLAHLIQMSRNLKLSKPGQLSVCSSTSLQPIFLAHMDSVTPSGSHGFGHTKLRTRIGIYQRNVSWWPSLSTCQWNIALFIAGSQVQWRRGNRVVDHPSRVCGLEWICGTNSKNTSEEKWSPHQTECWELWKTYWSLGEGNTRSHTMLRNRILTLANCTL